MSIEPRIPDAVPPFRPWVVPPGFGVLCGGAALAPGRGKLSKTRFRSPISVCTAKALPPRPTQGTSRAPRAGFTLIELLVVVAIIGVLAALLLPVLSRTKASAARVRCVSNLHQLGLAGHMYWDDNGGACFRYGGTSTNGGQLYWFGWIGAGAEGARVFDPVPGALYSYLQGRGVESCPALNSSLARLKAKAIGATYGYGYNLFLSAPALKPPVKVTRATPASSIIFLGDAAQVNTWQPPASPGNPMLEEWYYLDDSTNQPNGHFRHSGKANAVFCDGHVGAERCVPGSIDPRLPGYWVARFRSELLVLPP